MKIFNLPFEVANEVVKRNHNDNRRLRELSVTGGNNIFYLGSDTKLRAIFLGNDSLLSKLDRILSLLGDKNRHPIAIQNNEGIHVRHRINKKRLLSLLPFLDSFLYTYRASYHDPNLDLKFIKNSIDKITGEDIVFESDLVYIHDRISKKPYFKWFNQKPTVDNWKLVQEFLIPKLSFLNFEYENFRDNTLNIVWELTYAPVVTYSSDNFEDIISNSVEHLISNEIERETIREAIVRIRIGQSQFRNDLFRLSNKSCLFTEITNDNLLIASHIKPWKDSTGSERLDNNNGLLLSPTFDKLFDRFLITFNDKGELMWSKNRLSEEDINRLKKSIAKRKIRVVMNENNRKYYDFHRKRFNKLESEA